MRPRRVSVAIMAAFLFTSPAFAGYRIAAWIPGWDPNALTSTQTHAGLMSESNPTWYNFNSDGSIGTKTAENDPTWRAAMTGTALMPTIQNTTASGFNQSLALQVLSTATTRESHAEAIRQVVLTKGYDGIDVDYENLPLSARANFSAFVQLLASKLHADSKKLSVTVYAKTSDSETWDGAGGEDYAAIGAAADYVKLMVYDYSWSTSAPGPITPLSWLDTCVGYAVSVMPASKVMVGLPWYGYDWPSKGAAADLTFATGVSTAQKNAATTGYDANGEATYTYTGGHTVYYLDNAGHNKQIDLVVQKYPNVAGFCYWYIGAEDPAVWTRIQSLIGTITPPPPAANPPAAPSSLSTTLTSPTAVTLSWADNATDESGFSIERCADTQAVCDATPSLYVQVAQVGANSTSFVDSSRAASATYTYRVRAFNGGGNSTYSNTSSVTTPAIVLPPANAVAGSTLIAAGSVWRYLDDGSDQGTAWRPASFNDATWKSGAAELGYGDGDEKTVVSYGPSSSNKYITTYFRYSFDLADPGAYGSLNLRLIRDDGAVVYLNGVEVLRRNMNSGTVLYNTLALPASDDGKTWFTGTIPVSALVAGRNTIAVEVHQDAASSSDISFNFELTGTLPPPAAPSALQAVAASQSSINLSWQDNSSTETGFYVERCTGDAATCTTFTQIAQLGANVTTYSAAALNANTTYTFRVRAYSADGNSAFTTPAAATTLAPPPPPVAPSGLTAVATSYSTIDLTWTDNSSDESGFTIERCAGAAATCTAFTQIAQVGANATTYTAAVLTGSTSYTFRVSAFNANGTSAYSNVAAATTAVAPGPQNATLIPFGATWKYLDNGSNQGTAWIAPTFNDSAWKSGAGELGYGDGDEKTVVSYGPSSSNKFITTYFRSTFNVPNPAAFQSLLLRLVRDDGAVIYINGVEVWRSNMPAGTITYTTLSATGVAGTDESKIWEQTISPSVLVAGTNVIAVEIHQDLPTSSDISFNLAMIGN